MGGTSQPQKGTLAPSRAGRRSEMIGRALDA